MKEPEIDFDQLGALLDGRLTGPAREQALRRLAESDEALEVYAAALAATVHLEAEDARAAGPAPAAGDAAASASSVVSVADAVGAPGEALGAKVLPLRPPARRPVWSRPGARVLALAAGIAAVAVGVATWGRGTGDAPDDPGRYAALLDGAGLPRGWRDTPWAPVRGGEPLAPRARGVRVGAWITTLQAAAAAGDSARVRQAAAELGALLETLPSAGPVQAVYEEIRRRSGEPASTLEPVLERGRRSAARLAGEEWVALGAWAQAARLAAARRDAAFFRSRESRAELERAGRLQLPPAARASLAALRAAANASAPPAWDAAGRSAAELLAAAGGG